MSQSNQGRYLADNLQKSIAYGMELAKEIPADKFAHMPMPNMNHPAWCFGHLALYPERGLTLMGRADLAEEREDWTALFKAGVECDADASKYPGKDEILERFKQRHDLIAELLPSVPDSVFDAPLPVKEMANFFPKVGHSLHFLFANHVMMHLGQVSTWRRVMGLKRVF